MTTPRTPPVFTPPEPEEAAPASEQPPAEPTNACSTKPPRHDDPTRYGDWELSGKCVDF